LVHWATRVVRGITKQAKKICAAAQQKPVCAALDVINANKSHIVAGFPAHFGTSEVAARCHRVEGGIPMFNPNHSRRIPYAEETHGDHGHYRLDAWRRSRRRHAAISESVDTTGRD
jgi:hypothetical protein